MREMIKLADGTWTYNASTPNADITVDLPNGNIPIEDDTKPRRKARERKAKP
jgi:hypothetical protein